MHIQEKLSKYQAVFLDTAPIIYFVEKNPQFFPVVEAIFDAIDSGKITAFTSPITLSESLIFPFKQENKELANVFSSLIVNANNTRFVNIDEDIGFLAAQLRVKYNLSLTDAIQIATAINAKCDGFLTNDIQLKRVTEIEIIVIKEFEV